MKYVILYTGNLFIALTEHSERGQYIESDSSRDVLVAKLKALGYTVDVNNTFNGEK